MPTTWLRTGLALVFAVFAAGIAALLLHLPVPGAIDGPPSLAALVSYLKPLAFFGWPAAIVAVLLAPRTSLLRGLLYWLFAGVVIGAAGLIWMKHAELAGFAERSAQFILAKFAVTGALGGLIYWFFAGRSAAAGEAGTASPFSAGNLAMASLIGLLPPLLANFTPDNLLQTVKVEAQIPTTAPMAPASAPAAKSADEEKRLADEAAKRKADEDKRLADEAAKHKAAENKGPTDEAAKHKAAEDKRLADEAAKRKADEDKRLADEAAKHKAAEDKRLADEAAKRKADEDKRLADEAAKRKADEDKRLADEAAKRKADEDKRLADEAAKRKAAEDKRLADEAAKRKADEDKRLADEAAKSKTEEGKQRPEAAKSSVQAACAEDLKLLLTSKLIKFGTSSSALTDEAASYLGRVAEKLKPCADFRVTIGGYSDTSGSADHNLQISTARAEAVKAALVQRGVAADRITVRGYGSTIPQAGADDARAETPGRKAVIAVFDTHTPGAAPVTGASEAPASPQAITCSADAGKLLLSETLYFGSGSPIVRSTQRQALRQLAAFAKRCDNVRVIVTGHTDNVGSDTSNEELSNARAGRVARLLTSLGAPKDRIVTNGIGAARPVDTNDTPEGRAHNRRVVIGFEPA